MNKSHAIGTAVPRPAKRFKRAARKHLLASLALWLLSVVLFLLGLFLPSYVAYPSLGSFWADALVGALTQMDLTAQKKSIYGTIASLLSRQDMLTRFLGVVLAAFSIGFPVAKYVALAVVAVLGREPARIKNFLAWGYFSMVEVYVVAVLAAVLIPFIAIRPQIGLIPFFLSVVVGYLCHKSIAAYVACLHEETIG